MKTSILKSAAFAAVVLTSSVAFAGKVPTSATTSPSGSIVTNDAVVSQLIAISGTTQPPAVVADIGTQIANAGGSYNAATGIVRAFVDAGGNGIFLLTIENGQLSFTPVES